MTAREWAEKVVWGWAQKWNGPIRPIQEIDLNQKSIRDIEAVVLQAVAAEREACAKLAEAEANLYRANGDILTGLRAQQAIVCDRLAAAIRSRSTAADYPKEQQ